jgi:Domain of unknown function (DUF4279)
MENEEAESDYPSCARCYASVYVYAGDLDPDVISERMEIEPTVTHRKGERARGEPGATNPQSVWALSSKGRVDSCDLGKHLAWLLDNFMLREAAMGSLRALGCVFRVWCYWQSKYGQGGPTISVPLVKALAQLELEVCLDIYFFGEPGANTESEADA